MQKPGRNPFLSGTQVLEVRISTVGSEPVFFIVGPPVVSVVFKSKLASECEARCSQGGFMGFFQSTVRCSLESYSFSHWRGLDYRSGWWRWRWRFQGKKFCYFWVVDGVRSLDLEPWETCYTVLVIQLCCFIVGQESGVPSFPLWLMKY